jgi:hypothetical protein
MQECREKTAGAGGVDMFWLPKTDQVGAESSAAKNADNGTGSHVSERKIYNSVKTNWS